MRRYLLSLALCCALLGLFSSLAACHGSEEKVFKDRGVPDIVLEPDEYLLPDSPPVTPDLAQPDVSIVPDKNFSEGLGTGAYGDKCLGTCITGHSCIMITDIGSTTYGFCTKLCSGSTDYTTCSTSAPTGTFGACALSDSAQTKWYCGFVCEYGSTTYPCPPTLACFSTTTSGFKICAAQ